MRLRRLIDVLSRSVRSALPCPRLAVDDEPAMSVAGPLRADAATALSCLVALVFAVPSQLIVGPLGASGTPAYVLGMLLLLWWGLVLLAPHLGLRPGRNPVRLVLLALGAAVLASYAAGMLRPATAAEISAADRGLLAAAAWLGIALMATDGIPSRARLDVLLRRLVHAAAFLAVLGLLQFSLGLDIAGYLHYPGLRVNGDIAVVQERSGFRRVAGTATHPIEFGVTLALLLPLALHFALNGPASRRKTPWLEVLLIAVALFTSLSRAAFVAVGVVAVVLFPAWSRRRRRQALLVLPVFLVCVRLAVPGLVGTIVSLFTNFSTDPSTTARMDRYGIAGHFLSERPLLGRGLFTFLPSQYLIFDNQYVLAAMELGLVGVCVLMAMFLVSAAAARGARHRFTDQPGRELGQALAAAVLAGGTTVATYDAFSFPMATVVTFLLIGCCGALWRLSVEPPPEALVEDERPLPEARMVG